MDRTNRRHGIGAAVSALLVVAKYQGSGGTNDVASCVCSAGF